VQGTGLGERARAAFEEVREVLAAAGLEFEGVFEGAGGFFGAVDFR
jgi:hypothetical protein